MVSLQEDWRIGNERRAARLTLCVGKGRARGRVRVNCTRVNSLHGCFEASRQSWLGSGSSMVGAELHRVNQRAHCFTSHIFACKTCKVYELQAFHLIATIAAVIIVSALQQNAPQGTQIQIRCKENRTFY